MSGNLNQKDVEPPDPEKIPDNGEFFIAVKGGIVMLGVKRGGPLVSQTVWCKMNLWQAMAIFGGFIAAYANNQIEEILKQIGAKPSLHN